MSTGADVWPDSLMMSPGETNCDSIFVSWIPSGEKVTTVTSLVFSNLSDLALWTSSTPSLMEVTSRTNSSVTTVLYGSMGV